MIDVVKLAREAGGEEYGPLTWNMTFKEESLRRFAALIVEECAKECISVGAEHPKHIEASIRDVSKWCAAAIRSLVEGK